MSHNIQRFTIHNVLFLIISSFFEQLGKTMYQIYSKLETGKMPTIVEIIQALEAAGLKRGG